MGSSWSEEFAMLANSKMLGFKFHRDFTLRPAEVNATANTANSSFKSLGSYIFYFSLYNYMYIIMLIWLSAHF